MRTNERLLRQLNAVLDLLRGPTGDERETLLEVDRIVEECLSDVASPPRVDVYKNQGGWITRTSEGVTSLHLRFKLRDANGLFDPELWKAKRSYGGIHAWVVGTPADYTNPADGAEEVKYCPATGMLRWPDGSPFERAPSVWFTDTRRVLAERQGEEDEQTTD